MLFSVLEHAFIYWQCRHDFEPTFALKNIVIEIAEVNAVSTIVSVFTAHLSSTTNDIATVAGTVFVLNFLHIETVDEIIISKNAVIYSIIVNLMDLTIALEVLEFVARNTMLLFVFESHKAVTLAIHGINI